MKKILVVLLWCMFIYVGVGSAQSSETKNLKVFELKTSGDDLMVLGDAFKTYQKDPNHVEYSKKIVGEKGFY